MSNEIQETLRLETPEPGRVRFGPNSVLRQRYRLDSEIGRGGMGIVYRATDLDLKRPVFEKAIAAYGRALKPLGRAPARRLPIANRRFSAGKFPGLGNCLDNMIVLCTSAVGGNQLSACEHSAWADPIKTGEEPNELVGS